VARIVLLDSGPLGLASGRHGKPQADRCRAWVWDLDAAGVRVIVPELADYEVRRELLRARATAGIRRLDLLEANLEYAPLTTAAMRIAAMFWATARQAGLPTAADAELDGDAILAAQAIQVGKLGDDVTIATTNVGHLNRFPGVDAREWEQIVP
jgi:predicted nucleic acid-binding protein